MKKFFLIPLLTLVCSVMAFAVDVSTFADLKNELTKGTEPTITLTSDITIDGSTSIQRDVTIDLNWHTLTDGTNYISVAKGNVTVKNGFIRVASKNSFFLAIGTNNTLTFKNVKKVADQDPNVGTIMYNDGTDVSRQLIQVQQQGGTLTLDSDCDLNILGTVGATITNNGTGTIYLKPAINNNNDNTVKTYLASLPATTRIVPSSIYAPLYEDYVPYFYPGVEGRMYLTLTGTGEGIETYQLKSTSNTGKYKLEKGGKTYYFKNMQDAMTYSTNEYPYKLQGDTSLATLTYAGYLDLNGKTLTLTKNGQKIVKVENRQLTIRNSQSPAGGIEIAGTGEQSDWAFDIKPSSTSKANYSVLTIEEGVTINMPNYIGYVFAVYSTTNGYGTVLNMNGTVNAPNGRGITLSGNIKAVDPNAPIFNIGGTINAKGIGIYAAGYGKWNINDGAQIIGHTGIAIKAGQLSLNGQVIANGDDGQRTDTWGNGVIGSNAALQIESNPSYAGEMEITIGSTANLSSTGWYAIYEYGSANTAVKSIAVTGGKFQGGILISQSLAAKGGFVSGGKWSKDVSANIKAGENLSLLNNEDADASIYPYLVGVPTPAQEADYAEKDANNNAVLTNAASQSAAASYSSDNVGNDPEVIATKETNPVVVSENTDVVATEAAPVVEVKKVTVDNDAQLTVTEGATLVVGAGAVTLDETSSNGLTVEAGATLVVDGLIYGSTEDNFVIESQEGKSGIVLFSPETEFIREDHPKATYRFTSKAFWSQAESKWVYQRFGVPTFDGHATLQWLNNPGGGVNSWVKKWDYENDDWTSWTAFSGDVLEINDAIPFQGLMLASDNVKPDNTNPAMVYEFTGSLMGNSDANLHFYYGWNYYANSYTAPININEFIQTVKTSLGGSNDILATIYLYQDLGNDTYTWQAVNEFTAGSSTVVGFAPGVGPIYENVPSVINPMQAFLMRLNVEGEANQTIDYADNVYTPATTNTFNPAPARNRVTNNSMQISVFNANGNFDKVFFVENDNFSNDLDNGFDAYKYDGNKGVSLYAMSADKHMEILASNDVDGSFIGINAPEAGNYTLYFSGIQGMNYALIDMTNNTVVTIEEGGQFNFYAEAGQNDYRFQLVAPARVPTAVENVGAKADVKGVYTITGQYLGEDINALPKGVYIINGAKVVK